MGAERAPAPQFGVVPDEVVAEQQGDDDEDGAAHDDIAQPAEDQEDVHKIDPRALRFSPDEKRMSLFLEGSMKRAQAMTLKLQMTEASSLQATLSTPDQMFLAELAFAHQLRPVATIQVPNAGSSRGSDRMFTSVAWNNSNVPPPILEFRRLLLSEMERRFPITADAVPSEVTCVAVMVNPDFDPQLVFRNPAVHAVAKAHYDKWFDEAVAVSCSLVFRTVVSLSRRPVVVQVCLGRISEQAPASPGEGRRSRPRTGPSAGDIDSDMDMFRRSRATTEHGDAPSEPSPAQAARAKLMAEKAQFMAIPPAHLEAAYVEGKFNVLKFYALWKDIYPVHFEIALAVYGCVLNEANVERIFSFSSRTLDDRRTQLGAAVFEAFVVVGMNYPPEVLDPELIEEVLQEYYTVADTSGDHDTDDPTEEKEEDADEDQEEEEAEQQADPDGGVVGYVPTPRAAVGGGTAVGTAGRGAAVRAAIGVATPGSD